MKRLEPTPRVGGFTLTEMIVSVAIAGILILAIAQVFTSVSAAVDRGSAAGNVINKARSIGDQIRRDAAQMVGPREGGVMVIINHVTSDVAILPEDIDAGIARPVRTDQLMFIRRRGGLQPMTPRDSGSLSNSSNAVYAKVWLGHALEADASGRANPSELTGPALDWILGRQALLLDPSPASSSSDLDGATADGAFYDAGITTNLGSSISGPTLRHGLSDVAHYGLTRERSDNDAGNTEPWEHGAMTGVRPSGSGSADQANDGPPLYHDRRLWRTLSPNEYADRAYDYTYAAGRLLARPVPVGAAYDAWQIAQMHPVLGRRVTDVVVEFAGDYDGTAGLDRAGGAIRWYGLNDMPGTTSDPGNDPGQFVAASVSEVCANPIVDTTPPPDQASRAFVFRHGPEQTNWPHLIRVRYRVHDADGSVRGTDNRPGVWFEQVLRVNRDG